MQKPLEKNSYSCEDLVQIVEMLRSPEGCPWDRAQDHHTIRNNFLEETYEAVEAIDRSDPVLLQEELGDVLLQIVLHAQMEAETGRFDFNAEKGGCTADRPDDELRQALEQALTAGEEQSSASWGKLLFLISARMNRKGLSAEEALSHESDRMIESFLGRNHSEA